MKRNIIIAIIVFVISQSAMSATPQNTVTIKYSGSVHIPPCNVITKNVNIDFDTIIDNTLKDTGQTTAWKTFEISLENCGSNNVVVSTSGTPSSNKDYYLPTGTASNVDVELSDDDGMIYSNGASKTYTLATGVTSIDIPFKTRLRNNGQGAVTAGKVSCTITINFFYK